jgi:dipeptidyl aminopeptidase/acylaminoacyl peptidase
MPDALDGDFSRSRAVLIGSWDYRRLGPVPAAEHSLNRMRSLLMSPRCGDWPKSRVSVVSNRATLGDLPHELVTWFSSAADVALFYYVGHGQYDNDDRLCLALADSSPDAIMRTTTSLTFDAVRHAFRVSKATTKIAILDCCFAEIAAGRDVLAGPEVQALPRSPGFYLMMASGEFSTAWFQSASESPQPQTFFTKYLADVIEGGIPGLPEGLTLGPIFDKVADALVRDRKPEPHCRVSDHAAHFVFARNAIAAARPATPAPARDSGSARPALTAERALVSAPSLTVTIKACTGLWHTVTDIAFSPDGRMLATAGTDKTIRLWDPATGQTAGPSLVGHSEVWRIVFGPDGRILATATADHTVRLWDVATGQPAGHPLTCPSVVFSPDGHVIAGAGADNTVQLWDPVTGWPVGDALAGHTDTVYCVAFSPDGRLLATASRDETVRLWDPVKGGQVGQPLTGHGAGVNSVAFSPDGRLIATASADHTVRLWDLAGYQQLGQPLSGHTAFVDCVAFSPDGRLLASSGSDRTVRLWDPVTHRQVGILSSDHIWLDRVAFSPDGRLLAGKNSRGKAVQLWDTVTGRPVSIPGDRARAVRSVSFSPDGRLLATARPKFVHVWHQATNSQPDGHRKDRSLARVNPSDSSGRLD